MPDHRGEREANRRPLCKALRVGWRSCSLMELSHHCKIKKYTTTCYKHDATHTRFGWDGRLLVCMSHAYNAGLRFGALRQVTLGAWHVGPTGGRPTCHTHKGSWRHGTSTWIIIGYECWLHLCVQCIEI